MGSSSLQLVVLIGAARSGTKFLRDVLASSSHVCAIPYDINYVWRYGQERRSDDHIPASEATDPVRHYIASRLRGMAGASTNHDCRIVIEKTVSNVFRVPYVHCLFPEALFIHLVRDGRDVAESAARMWDAPPNYRYLIRKLQTFPVRNVRYAAWFLKNLVTARWRGEVGAGIWGPRYPGIQQDLPGLSTIEIAAKQWSESVRSALRGLEAVAPERQMLVRYEDLVENSAELERVLAFIAVPDFEQVVAAYRNTVRSDRRDRWKSLPQEDQLKIHALEQDMLAALKYLDAPAEV